MQMFLESGQISDLFFNYDNAALAAAYAANQKNDGLSEDEVIEAITKDAEEFAACYPSDLPKEEFVNWLVSDFLKRR